MISELSDLVKNYEDQVEDYVGEIGKKQAFIDDLTCSRDKVNQMIVEMEDNLQKNKEHKTPMRRSTTHSGSQGDIGSTLDSPVSRGSKGPKDEVKVINTNQKIEIALSERERMHNQRLAEMEENMKYHTDQIRRLEEENKQYNVKVVRVKEHEEELKQKITRYQ